MIIQKRLVEQGWWNSQDENVQKIKLLILCILIILIGLDFVPIKFAVKLDDVKKNLDVGKYICSTEAKYSEYTGLIAKVSSNQHIDQNICVIASGNSPDEILSEKTFDFEWFEVENIFLLDGKVEKFEEDKRTNSLYADLYVDNWKVIYPIKRATFRQYYAPKTYLTIYDFDWLKVIKLLFNKK